LTIQLVSAACLPGRPDRRSMKAARKIKLNEGEVGIFADLAWPPCSTMTPSMPVVPLLIPKGNQF
jgi:hypothetical protein